jgi:hypothetical protein
MLLLLPLLLGLRLLLLLLFVVLDSASFATAVICCR